MSFPSAFTAVGSTLGILGFAILLAAAVLTLVADVADVGGHDLAGRADEEGGR